MAAPVMKVTAWDTSPTNGAASRLTCSLFIIPSLSRIKKSQDIQKYYISTVN